MTTLVHAHHPETVPASFLDVAGQPRLALRCSGHGGTKAPVILLHGLQSHSGWFLQSAQHIASDGHPVYSFDRRGSGCSEGERGHLGDWRDLLADMQAVAARIEKDTGAQRVHVIGQCFGTLPATLYACHHPDRVLSLTLASPALFTRVSPGWEERARILFSMLGRGRALVPVPFTDGMMTDDPQYLDFMRSDPLAVRRLTASFYAQIVFARQHLNRCSHELRCPVFLATAGRDEICDSERNVEYFEKLPQVSKHRVNYPRAKHILEFSADRAAFFNDLAAWLDRTEPSRAA
jgi:alpha-beta hydrolase superfamily lysophospholipase